MGNDSNALKVRILMGSYPNTLPLRNGEIKSTRVSLEYDPEKTSNLVFKRVVNQLEFNIAELALATFLQAKAYGRPLALLPIVIRGKFAHNAIAYNARLNHLTPADLAGRRVGIRAWAQTTPLWVRGFLENDYGVDLKSIKWVTFEDSHVSESLDPAGVERAPAGKKLRQMLLDGELDAAMVSEQRDAKDPSLKTLIHDAAATAQEWHKKYQVVPINHMVVVKQSFLKEHPDVVKEVFDMLVASKQAAGFPRDGGLDTFPVGVEAIRKSLEMGIKYSVQQGLIPRAYTVDELFDDFTRTLGK